MRTKSWMLLLLNVAVIAFSSAISGATPRIAADETSGWISSGGELFASGRNPWFVRNTAEVKYCIEMDEASFSVSKDTATSLIQAALEFWFLEFKTNREFFSSSTGTAAIATQKFVSSTCSDNVDLQFKFGANTLTQEEREKGGLTEPRRFIGVAVRKTYDPIALKGRGLIFISADKGATAYFNSGELIDQAWREPGLLKYALIHELGHVFGIPHVGAGLMSEVFMDTLLNKRLVDAYLSEPQQSFLNAPADFDVCRLTGKFNPDFFQVAKGSPCLLFRHVAGSAMAWNVFAADELKKNPVAAGVVQAVSLETSPYNLKPAVTVQLPHEQMELPPARRVFQPAETMMGPFLVGAVFSQQSFRAVFRPVNNGRPLTFQMSLSADQVTFVGTLNQQQMTVLNWGPLSFMRALLP